MSRLGLHAPLTERSLIRPEVPELIAFGLQWFVTASARLAGLKESKRLVARSWLSFCHSLATGMQQVLDQTSIAKASIPAPPPIRVSVWTTPDHLKPMILMGFFVFCSGLREARTNTVCRHVNDRDPIDFATH